jgi:hypothetical protein
MNNVPSREAMRVSNNELVERGGNNSIARERLDGWKEIAAYLRRSVRCVQRWERAEGLPVFRHPHKKGATVYAYRHEVDRWWDGESADVSGTWKNRAGSTYQLQDVGASDQRLLANG